MRIGLIAPPWLPVPPVAYGGTEGVIDALARGYQAAGHDVLLWAAGDSTCPVPRAHVLGAAASERMGEVTTEVHHVLRGYDALRAWGAELVHDHSVSGPALGPSVIDAPVITTNHGPFEGDLLGIYETIAGRVPVIAISHDQASRAPHVPIAAVIHHGIDVDSVAVGHGRGDSDGDHLLFLGRMAPEKGVREAALAAKLTHRRLLIAAKQREPKEIEYFEKQIEPLLDDDVVYVGEVGYAEKLRLLQNASALLNPIQWNEPFGLVMIEALACGTPVVTYARGAAGEIVTEGVTGYVCEDLDGLVVAIEAIDGIDRAACRADAEARFTAKRMVDEHLALFRTLRVAGVTGTARP